MIVHGDAGSEECLASIAASLDAGVNRALLHEQEGSRVSCDALRRILIQAGELEQGASDAPSTLGPRSRSRALLRAIRRATSLAARAFHHACESPGAVNGAKRPVHDALDRLRRVIGRFSNGNGIHGRAWIKVPESFVFGGHFPEHYRDAANRWADEHAGDPAMEVRVVGIRSAGTTLSAIVTATLRARGVRARRVTVRPGARASNDALRWAKARPTVCWLIVDEGPGANASSASAVADALARAGLGPIHVIDAAASVPLEELRLGGLRLPEALWAALDADRKDPLARVLACGNGAWRSLHYASSDSWPSVCPGFERPKILCEGESGRRILFKFAGLATAPGAASYAAEVHARKLGRLALEGLTPAPLGTAHGFIATEWIAGRPLDASDATPDLLRRIGGYVTAAAGPALSSTAARASRARLETMLCVNASEALGDDAARAAFSLLGPIPALEGMPRSGDGHLAPHEWIVTPQGRILKTDAGGHDFDPTWTGRQPVLWDLAGAVLEWNLEAGQVAALLDGFHAAGGEPFGPFALDAYCAAYAAHRMGQFRHGADLETDPDERRRMEGSYRKWRDLLAALLGAPPEM